MKRAGIESWKTAKNLQSLMVMKLLQLLSPCIFGHGDMLRTRDEEGHLALQCAECGQATRVLEKPAIRGPKHHAAPVKGAPLLTVKRFDLRKLSFPRSA